MSVFKCKMCGATLNIPKDTNVFKCEYCDTEQTVPIINSQEKEDLYERANYFFHNNEYDKAAKIYEEISNLDQRDPESYFMQSLCKYGIEYVEDPKSKKRIPTLHRLHFESISNDINYKKAIKHADSAQKVLYENQAKYIDEVRSKILDISKKEKPYDVFICYKETDEKGQRAEDSVIAMDVYNELTKEGLKVFFSRITLEGKLGVEYEPYIFAALNSAKVMVVVGTKPEYINSPWVRNEWTRFLDRVDSKQSNKNNAEKCYIVPAYKGMSPYALPNEFSSIQAQDMSKVGATQDLVHGIKKLLNKNTNEVSKVEINLNKKQKLIVLVSLIVVVLLTLLLFFAIFRKANKTVTIKGKEYTTIQNGTSLTFRDIKDFEENDIKNLNGLSGISKLSFYDSEFEDLEFLSKLKNITSVTFYTSIVKNYELNDICENIKVFTIGSVKKENGWGSIKFMEKMPNLEKVQITLPLYDLSPLSNHNMLEEIKLYAPQEGSSLDNFLWCEGLNSLKTLENSGSTININSFKGIENLKKLESLYLRLTIKGKSSFIDSSMENIFELSNLTKLHLKSYGMWSSDYDGITIELGNLKKMAKLQDIELSSHDRFNLNGIDNLKELKKFSLQGEILDDNMQKFSGLNKLETIKLEFTNHIPYGEEKKFSLRGVEKLENLNELSIDTGFNKIKILDEDLIESNQNLKYYKQGG